MSLLPIMPALGSEAEDDMGKLLTFKASPGGSDADTAIEVVQRYIDGCSKSTRALIEYQLTVAASCLGYASWRVCPWQTLDAARFKLLRVDLMEKVDKDDYVPQTANGILSCVRSILRELWIAELVPDATYKAVDAVKPIPGSRTRRRPRALTVEEFDRLIEWCALDPSDRGRRDALLFALAKTAGLRAKEYADLLVEDVSIERMEIRVRRGKGNKERYLPLADAVLPYLRAWLEVRGALTGPLFVGVHRGHALPPDPRPLTNNRINKIMKMRGKELGMPEFTSHATRRGCSTLLTNLTGNPAMAKETLGHSSISTTLKHYYNPGEDQVREAINKVGMPVVVKTHPAEAHPPDDAPPPLERILAALAVMQKQNGPPE